MQRQTQAKSQSKSLGMYETDKLRNKTLSLEVLLDWFGCYFHLNRNNRNTSTLCGDTQFVSSESLLISFK